MKNVDRTSMGMGLDFLYSACMLLFILLFFFIDINTDNYFLRIL